MALCNVSLNDNYIQQLSTLFEELKEKSSNAPESTTTSEPRNCEPIQKLAFAKTHKTGGKFRLVFPAGLSRPGKSRDVPGRDHPGTGLRDFFGPGTF